MAGILGIETDNDPINKQDPLGLRPKDGPFNLPVGECPVGKVPQVESLSPPSASVDPGTGAYQGSTRTVCVSGSMSPLECSAAEPSVLGDVSTAVSGQSSAMGVVSAGAGRVYVGAAGDRAVLSILMADEAALSNADEIVRTLEANKSVIQQNARTLGRYSNGFTIALIAGEATAVLVCGGSLLDALDAVDDDLVSWGAGLATAKLAGSACAGGGLYASAGCAAVGYVVGAIAGDKAYTWLEEQNFGFPDNCEVIIPLVMAECVEPVEYN